MGVEDLLWFDGLVDLAMGDTPLVFLLKADFNGPDIAAGSVPASLGEPYVTVGGPLAMVQNDGQFSISGNVLQIGAQTTPAWGDLGYISPVISRDAGITMRAYFHFSGGTHGGAGFGNGGIVPPLILSNWEHAYQREGSVYNVAFGNNRRSFLSLPASITEHVLILRKKGAFYFLGGQLVWIDDSMSTASIYAVLSTYNVTGPIDSLRVADLPANGYGVFDHRDLDVTSSSAAPAVANTGTMTPDAVVSFVCSAPSGTTELQVRYLDGSNTDSIKIDAAGNLTYNENGVALITGAATIAGGETVSAVLNDNVVSLYKNGTLIGTSSNADLNKANVLWRLDSEADAVTNLTARTLDGVANVGSSNHPGYGLATAVLPGPRAAGDTFTHEADCIIEFSLNALPVTNDFYFFREQDAEHRWYIQITPAGAYSLYEKNGAGPAVVRGTSGAVLVGGERMVIICSGESIRAFHNISLGISYASAATAKTATQGLIYITSDGRRSNLIAWPLDLESAPNTPGAADALEALTRMGA